MVLDGTNTERMGPVIKGREGKACPKCGVTESGTQTYSLLGYVPCMCLECLAVGQGRDLAKPPEAVAVAAEDEVKHGVAVG
jgi:hypothetical protein